MNSISKALNHPTEAFRHGSNAISWGLVAITIVINAVLEPVLQYFFGPTAPLPNAFRMLRLLILGTLTYVLICSAFYLVCRCLGSKATFLDHIKSWGISYAPTLVCSIVVAVTEVFFSIFWNSTIWGMLLSIVFVGILIWKSILYLIYLHDLAKLTGWRYFFALFVMAILFLGMAAANGYVGLKTPIL